MDFTVPGGAPVGQRARADAQRGHARPARPARRRARRPSRSTSTPRPPPSTATPGRAGGRASSSGRSSSRAACRSRSAAEGAAVRAARRATCPDRRAAAGRRLPLDVQLVEPDAFIADDRSGLFVGATTADATSLEAPLQALVDPAARPGGLVLRGHLAGAVRRPGVDRRRRTGRCSCSAAGRRATRPHRGALTHKVVDHVVSTGWASSTATCCSPTRRAAFTVDSRRWRRSRRPSRRSGPTPSGSSPASPCCCSCSRSRW